MATASAPREEKIRSGDDLKIDSGFGVVKVLFLAGSGCEGAPYTVTLLYARNQCGSVTGEVPGKSR